VALSFYIYKATRLIPYVFTPLKTLETSCITVTAVATSCASSELAIDVISLCSALCVNQCSYHA